MHHHGDCRGTRISMVTTGVYVRSIPLATYTVDVNPPPSPPSPWQHPSPLATHLNVECSGQLIAALSLHGLHISAMEGVQGKMLDLRIVLHTHPTCHQYTSSCHITKHTCTINTPTHTHIPHSHTYRPWGLLSHHITPHTTSIAQCTFLKKKWSAKWLSTMGLEESIV